MISNQPQQQQSNPQRIFLDQINWSQLCSYNATVIMKAMQTRFKRIELTQGPELYSMIFYTQQSIITIHGEDFYECVKKCCSFLSALYPNQSIAFTKIDEALLHNLGHAIENFIDEKDPSVCPHTIQSFRTNL
jgi:hypothetical protein